MAKNDSVTTYSAKIKGDPRNYDRAVRFDLTDGCLGITDFEGDAPGDRVLLSPAQVKELVNFVVGKKPARAA